MVREIFEFMFVYGQVGSVEIGVAILADSVAQAMERVGHAIPTEEAIYPGKTSGIKYLHLNADKPANREDIRWDYGPFLTDQNPEDGVYDSPDEMDEAPGCQEYSLSEYLEQFETPAASSIS
jgi:hypothetical protein